MRSVLLALFLSCLAAPLRSDVIALALSRSPFCLMEATVKVSVARRMAMVEAQYEYKYIPRFDQGPRSDSVAFEFPVFASKDTDSLASLVDITQPKLRVGAVEFAPVDFGPWSEAAGTALPFVPENVKVAILIFQVPRAVLRDRFSMSLTYFQPTYRFADQEVAAYLPLLPDFEALKNELLISRSDFTVEFEAVDAIRLHRLSANESVGQEAPGKVTVHPVHREIIAVAIEAAGPAGKAPAANPGESPR